MSPPTFLNSKRACEGDPDVTGKQATFNSTRVVPGRKVAVAVGVGVIDAVNVIEGVGVMLGVEVEVSVFDGVKVSVGRAVRLGVKVSVAVDV